jgi:hypothetical protein
LRIKENIRREAGKNAGFVSFDVEIRLYHLTEFIAYIKIIIGSAKSASRPKEILFTDPYAKNFITLS